MPRQLNDAEHVIALVHKETKKRGRAVTFGQIASASRRDREDLRKAADQLVADGVLVLENSPEGARGRPTVYMYLANKWIEPPPSLSRPLGQLVPTQEPSELSDKPLGDRAPEPAHVSIPEDSDPFLIIGPQWIKLISKSKNSELNPDKVLDLINHFADKYGIPPGESVNIWNRLKKPEYDEYWTEYGIESVTKRRADGTRDRRYGSDGQVYALRHEVAPNLEKKKEEQEHAQAIQVADRIDRGWNKTEEEAREVLQLPEPSADLPDMTAFKARLRAIMSE